MALQKGLLKKILIVGGSLCAIQVVAILYMSSNSSTEKSPQQSIETAVAKLSDLPPERKEMMKIQLAIADYTSKHEGNPPQTLAQLMPEYFQTLPIDSSTGKPFRYTVEGKRYMLGERTAPTASAKTGAQPSVPGMPEVKKTMSPKELDSAREELFAVLTQDDSRKGPAYDSSGKKDPFKPFDLSPKGDLNSNKTALEQLPIDKLTYSAYLESDEPKAIIETGEGRGYTVKKGTKVGMNQGEITDILPSKIIVVETLTDFTGEKQTRTFEIPIGVKADSNELRRP